MILPPSLPVWPSSVGYYCAFCFGWVLMRLGLNCMFITEVKKVPNFLSLAIFQFILLTWDHLFCLHLTCTASYQRYSPCLLQLWPWVWVEGFLCPAHHGGTRHGQIPNSTSFCPFCLWGTLRRDNSKGWMGWTHLAKLCPEGSLSNSQGHVCTDVLRSTWTIISLLPSSDKSTKFLHVTTNLTHLKHFFRSVIHSGHFT